MSLPYFPMFPSDFEAKTSHLTLEEDGAYNRLLRIMWMTPGCSVPDNDAWIARRMRVDEATYERVVRVVIDEFCTREGGRVRNSKLTEIFHDSSERHEKRVSAGSKGGKAKALKTNDTGPSNAKAKPKQPEPEPEVKEERSYDLLSPDADAQSIDAVATAVSAYNAAATASGWPKVQTMNPKRRASLKARLKECGGIEGWEVALAKAQASDHCCGRNNRGWTANFDFLTQQTSFAKLMEGNYDNRTDSSQRQPDRQQNRADPALEQIARLAGIGAA